MEEIIKEIISEYKKLDEVEAITLAGSRAAGRNDQQSDVVCGGFSMPIRNGYADEVYIVTSGEMMSMYAASNISTAVNQFKNRGYASLKGLILNAKNVENEYELVQKLATEINSSIYHYIPRDKVVQLSENDGKTVIEKESSCEMANVYLELAKKIIA